MRTRFFNSLAKVAFMSMLALSFHACSDNEQFDTPSTPAMEENHIHSADTGVKFTSEAVIIGVSGNQAGEITTALNQLLTNVSSTVTDKTQLLIVPNLSDRYKKDIDTVYNNGGIIAVTNPNDAELDEWFKANNWENKMLSNGTKGAIMFSFAKNYHCCITTSHRKHTKQRCRHARQKKHRCRKHRENCRL